MNLTNLIQPNDSDEDILEHSKNKKVLDNFQKIFFQLLQSIDFKTEIRYKIGDSTQTSSSKGKNICYCLIIINFIVTELGNIVLELHFKNPEFKLRIGDEVCV